MADGTNRVIDDTKIHAWAKLPYLFSVIRGLTIQSTEPRTIKPVAETFNKLMRQIYVEQVWRQNKQSGTNPAGDRKGGPSYVTSGRMAGDRAMGPQLETHTVLTRSYTSG
jgi:hypothetical protein